MLLFLPLACTSGLVDYPSEDEATEIFKIEPDVGHPDGGDVVTLTGQGFVGEISVNFGNVPAAQITPLSDDTLVVTTPRIGIEATVDIEISTDNGPDRLLEGFSFRFDTPLGSDDDTDDVPIASGLTGGLVQITRIQTACASCFVGLSEITVTAEAAIHEPENGSWIEWMPPIGSCSTNPSAPPLSDETWNVGDWAYLQAGPRSLSLHRTSSELGATYSASGLTVDDYVGASFYDLSVPDGGSLGPIEVVDAVLTPVGFDSIQPAELLYNTPELAFSALIAQSGHTVYWSPAGADQFLVIVGVYSPDGTQYLGSVLCRGFDTGNLTLPGTYLAAYPAYSLLEVMLIRMEQSFAVLPNNGASIEGIGQAGFRGTAILWP